MDIMKSNFWYSLFRNKSEELIEVPNLTVDLHSHLLPGIDDGAKDMEESIFLIKSLMKCGYRKLIITPHIMIDYYGNTKVSILEKFYTLKNEIIKRKLAINIDIAAEYYLDEGLLPLIQSNDLLLVADKYLLFETSYTHRPQQLEEIIYEILALGYTPLMAHPERYRYINNLEKEYRGLKDRGVEFQIDLNSLNGFYGKNAKKKALFLTRYGMVSFLGSDTHNIKHVDNLNKVFDLPDYSAIYRYNQIKNESL